MEFTQELSCADYKEALKSNASNKLIRSCSRSELIFDTSVVLTSVTQEYGLICDEILLRSLFNSLYLGGMLIGSFVIGILSDKWGRLRVHLNSCVSKISSGAERAKQAEPNLTPRLPGAIRKKMAKKVAVASEASF